MTIISTYISDDGIRTADISLHKSTGFIIEMYESTALIERRIIENTPYDHVEDCADNWVRYIV